MPSFAGSSRLLLKTILPVISRSETSDSGVFSGMVTASQAVEKNPLP
jgi:hypothetical protein